MKSQSTHKVVAIGASNWGHRSLFARAERPFRRCAGHGRGAWRFPRQKCKWANKKVTGTPIAHGSTRAPWRLLGTSRMHAFSGLCRSSGSRGHSCHVPPRNMRDRAMGDTCISISCDRQPWSAWRHDERRAGGRVLLAVR